MKDMENEKAIFLTVRSELEQSLKTSTTQHALLQAHHTEVQKQIVHVTDQYKKCMETNLELLEMTGTVPHGQIQKSLCETALHRQGIPTKPV